MWGWAVLLCLLNTAVLESDLLHEWLYSLNLRESVTDQRHVGLLNLFSSFAQGLDQQLPVFVTLFEPGS